MRTFLVILLLLIAGVVRAGDPAAPAGSKLPPPPPAAQPTLDDAYLLLRDCHADADRVRVGFELMKRDLEAQRNYAAQLRAMLAVANSRVEALEKAEAGKR